EPKLCEALEYVVRSYRNLRDEELLSCPYAKRLDDLLDALQACSSIISCFIALDLLLLQSKLLGQLLLREAAGYARLNQNGWKLFKGRDFYRFVQFSLQAF